MSTQCKHKQLFPSVASTSRRKRAVGEMPSKKLLMKREGENEGPVLGSVFILAELEWSLQRKGGSALHLEKVTGQE